VTVRSYAREISISTGPGTKNVALSTSGDLTFYPKLHNSSATAIPEGSTTNTNFGPCLSGSTLTITTSGGNVEAIFTAELENDDTSAGAGVAILEDGHLPLELGPNYQKSIGGFRYSTAYGIPIKSTSKFRWLFTPPSAGVHSYCITINVGNGGTTTLRGRTANQFSISELK
jgi:hypothetical protein